MSHNGMASIKIGEEYDIKIPAGYKVTLWYFLGNNLLNKVE
jgi:hypothetical protein